MLWHWRTLTLAFTLFFHHSLAAIYTQKSVYTQDYYTDNGASSNYGYNRLRGRADSAYASYGAYGSSNSPNMDYYYSHVMQQASTWYPKPKYHRYRTRATRACLQRTSKCGSTCHITTTHHSISPSHVITQQGLLVGHRYMRACIDRLLLFGLPEDWLRRNMLTRRDRCTVVDRRELQARTLSAELHVPPDSAQSFSSSNIDYRSGLFKVPAKIQRHNDPDSQTYRRQKPGRKAIAITNDDSQKDLVTICSCLGSNCNSSPIVTNEASPGRLSRTSRTRLRLPLSTSPRSPWVSDSLLISLCSFITILLRTFRT